MTFRNWSMEEHVLPDNSLKAPQNLLPLYALKAVVSQRAVSHTRSFRRPNVYLAGYSAFTHNDLRSQKPVLIAFKEWKRDFLAAWIVYLLLKRKLYWLHIYSPCSIKCEKKLFNRIDQSLWLIRSDMLMQWCFLHVVWCCEHGPREDAMPECVPQEFCACLVKKPKWNKLNGFLRCPKGSLWPPTIATRTCSPQHPFAQYAT